MPPLPTTLDEDTQNLIAAAQRHERDLAEFQIPRLRSCQGPLSVQQSLAAELREDVDTLARQIEALDVLVDDQKGSKNKRELKAIVDDFNEKLASLRRESRTALLASKRTIDSLSKSRRDELLGSSAVSEKREVNEKVTDDALMDASDQVTTAMLRTMDLLQAQLKGSVLSAQMLESSTATLRSASSTHDTLTSVMDTSKQLINALEKSDWLDRVLIFSALFFFILVVLFILKQRIFDRSMRIAFWWTRFIPDFSSDEQLLSMEKGSATVLASTTALVTSSVASALSVLASSSAVESAQLPEETLSSLLDVADPVTEEATGVVESSVKGESSSTTVAAAVEEPAASTIPEHVEL